MIASALLDRRPRATPLQRRHQILDHIVGMLEPARQPHQAVADAELGARRRRQALMRRGRRMGDQALGVAEIVGDAHELERVLEAERAGLAALDLERHQVEPPRICRCTIAACGWSGRPG